MVTPLGTLLSLSFHRCGERLRPLLIGVLLFGSLVAIISSVANRRMEGHIWQGMQRLGMDQERMMELQEKLQSGGEGATWEAVQEMNAFTQGTEEMTEEERSALLAREGITMVKNVLPVLGFGFFGWTIIATLAMAYYLVLYLGDKQEAVEVLHDAVRVFFPLLGVWIWSFLRSFAWIPILGVIPAAILMPRFVMAPVILVQKHAGVIASVSESYGKTRGVWGKIVGNLLVLGLLSILASWVMGFLTLPLIAVSRVFSIWVHSVVQQLVMAYGVAFLVLLTKTIFLPLQQSPQTHQG